MTKKSYDLIVIGTGSAASAVAYTCRSADWQVAVIDSRPFGGTCAVRGCDPQKVLVGAAAGERPFKADLVVHGAGRVPEIEELELEKAGVESDRKKGIVVNKYLQSVSNPAVYAAGDAAATEGPPLTPVASLEGHVVASNLLKNNYKTADYAGIPSVVFTIPPLATVGMQEKTAGELGLKFRVLQKDTSSWYTSRRVAEEHSGFKTLVEEGSDRILGAHVLGPHAEEVINIFALAIRSEIPAGDVGRMIYAYPTSSSDISYMV